MPRIPDRYLYYAVYFYRSEPDARKGKASGASGFFVSVPSELYPFRYVHIYAVTNYHVAKQGWDVLRFNTGDGVYIRKLEVWAFSRTDDLAVAPVDLHESLFAFTYPILAEQFLPKSQTAEGLKIGIGDDVFMVGRFFGHEGTKQTNLPSIRFGHISMLTNERV